MINRLFYLTLCLLMVSCQANNKLPSMTKSPTTHPITVSGVFIEQDKTTYTLYETQLIVTSRDDIPNLLLVSAQEEDVVFNCDVTRYTSIGSVIKRRLCHLLPTGETRLIKTEAYGLIPDWSQDGMWYVFAGADNEREMVCQQRLYAYHRTSYALITLTEKPNSQVCAIVTLRWQLDTTPASLVYSVWTGREGEYLPHEVTFNLQ